MKGKSAMCMTRLGYSDSRWFELFELKNILITNEV
jgi:hypothetical protein